MTEISKFEKNYFGQLSLKIGIYLGVGICHLEFD